MNPKLSRAALGGAALTAAFAAPAQAGVRQDFSLGFTTGRPAANTGLSLHLYYKNPSDPNAKPPALTGLVIKLPAGTAFHTSAVTICMAGDTQLEIEGPSACPEKSHLTTGVFMAMTGVPPLDPFVGPDIIFNGGTSLIEDVVFPGTQITAGVDRLRIQGWSLTANPPARYQRAAVPGCIFRSSRAERGP